jgi:hypothetical protein
MITHVQVVLIEFGLEKPDATAGTGLAQVGPTRSVPQEEEEEIDVGAAAASAEDVSAAFVDPEADAAAAADGDAADAGPGDETSS